MKLIALNWIEISDWGFFICIIEEFDAAADAEEAIEWYNPFKTGVDFSLVSSTVVGEYSGDGIGVFPLSPWWVRWVL